jgi:hypothetical protein
VGYTFEAQTRFDKRFAGVVVPQIGMDSDTGERPRHLQPSDVYYQGEDDADYGRLLGRVYRKGRFVPNHSELEPGSLLP